MSDAGSFDLGVAARRRARALCALAGAESGSGGPIDELLARLDASEPGGTFDGAHRRLLLELQARGANIPHGIRPLERPPAWLQQFDAGFEGVLGEGCLRGVRSRGEAEISLAGIVDGATVDAVAAWMLAASVVTSVKARPERPVVVVLDAAAQTASAMDGSAPLSEYLAHLARAIGWARSQAVAVNLWVVGATDAASFVACAAGAARVVAFPGASLAADPAACVPDAGLAAGPSWITSGLVDELAQTARRVEIAGNAD